MKLNQKTKSVRRGQHTGYETYYSKHGKRYNKKRSTRRKTKDYQTVILLNQNSNQKITKSKSLSKRGTIQKIKLGNT